MIHGKEISPLAERDRDDWVRLWRAYLSFYGVEGTPALCELTFGRYVDPGRADMLSWIARDPDTKSALGIANVIVHAHGWHAAPVTYLQDLFTEETARGQGVARALIETVYADADAAGRPVVYWMTQTGNTTARRLYDRIAQPTDFMKYARP